ncbi:MAG TPA: hypothetical protein VMZ91_16310 [Candidatus Paceibacterota bacterium]|nr:hypothetical protein [Candidatus Paceibacterota bacterium]
MKQRIIEIMKELWETHLEYKQSRPETEQGYITLPYSILFSESVSTWRGEQAGKNKSFNKSYPTKPATPKQIAYAQQLADNKKFDLKITGKETSIEISKIIEGLKNK